MYLSPFGGSALLHLLAAHPRVVAVFGLLATVGLLANPVGRGQFAGSADHLERIERQLSGTDLGSVARQARAQREAALLLETADTAELRAAVADVLDHCGAGCTDLSTRVVMDDAELLRQVLVLHQLDLAVQAERPAAQTGD